MEASVIGSEKITLYCRCKCENIYLPHNFLPDVNVVLAHLRLLCLNVLNKHSSLDD